MLVHYTVEIAVVQTTLCSKALWIIYGKKKSELNQHSNVICSEKCKCNNRFTSQMSVNVGQNAIAVH